MMYMGFDSDDYEFRAVFGEGDDGHIWFGLTAVCVRTGRTSTVTNVNEVMSFYGADPNEKRFQESDWRLKDGEALEFVHRTVEMMIMGDLSWLDKAMNDDRAAGEWENLIGGE